MLTWILACFSHKMCLALTKLQVFKRSSLLSALEGLEDLEDLEDFVSFFDPLDPDPLDSAFADFFFGMFCSSFVWMSIALGAFG